MPIPYPFRLALQSFFKDKWINLISALTIGSGLLIISLAFLIAYNLDVATRNLPERFSMTVYLDDNIQKEAIDHAISVLRKNTSVQSVRLITKEEALRELKTTLKNSSYVFEGLDANPLPDSLEIKLKKETAGPEAAKRIADEAMKIKGVSDLDYGEKYIAAIHYLKVGLNTLGVVLISIMSLGVVFVCYSTVKILFYRRNEEIETFKLLGATKMFIRLPFLIEGAGIGLIGGLLSLVAIVAFHQLVIIKLSASIPLFTKILFPGQIFLGLPLLGTLLGMAGAALALGRLRY